MRHHTYGYIYAILAAFFFALIAIIGKGLVSGGTHPFQVSFYQYLFTILILGIWLYLRKPSALRCDRKRFLAFALLGVFGGGATTLLFYSALQYLDAGVTSMLLFINPVYYYNLLRRYKNQKNETDKLYLRSHRRKWGCTCP